MPTYRKDAYYSSSLNTFYIEGKPKKNKKGKVLKCWERNGFYNKK